jgi:hypothetical protein
MLNFRINLNEYRLYSNLNFNGFIIRRNTNKNDLKKITFVKESEESVENKKISEKEIIRETIPLINRDTLMNKNEIFDKLNSIVPNITFNSLKEKLAAKVGNSFLNSKGQVTQIFDVYAPNKNFKKSNPEATCKEKFRILNQAHQNKSTLYFPKLADFILADDSSKSNVNEKNIISFITNGNVTYYSIDFNFQMPDINNE